MSRFKLISEVNNGAWFLNPADVMIYTEIAHNFLTGKAVNLPNKPEVNSFVKIYDQNAKLVQPDANGNINVRKNSVAVIDMIGVLIKYGDWCTYGADEIVGAMDQANEDDNIAAIVLNINGPGGSVSAIPPFIEFNSRKKKPVIGLVEQCCSAHYYAAVSCCDHIMAANELSAEVGSIGVVLSFMDNRKKLEEMGYTLHEIYPKESENKNEAFRLALEGKYDMIKEEMLSPLAIDFQNAVKAGRPNLNTKIPGILNGKTFRAKQALEYGMIDTIGNLQNAINIGLIKSELNRV